MNTSNDTQHHFIFDRTPIRGNVARLDITFQDALRHQALPPLIKQTLGELMTAGALLISTLKMEGSMILQLQSKGILKLLVVECNSDLEMRATAKWEGDIQQKTLSDLVNHGQFVITLDPKTGEPYQGIVPIEGDSVAEMLEHYMLRSQQIDTSIWLSCNDQQAAGLLLQKLPNEHENDADADADAWNRINYLASTVTAEELNTLPAERLLQRLFHEEDVRLFAPRAIKAFCSCTREGVANMLKMLGQAEADSIIQEQGSIQTHCAFCNQHYVFDEADTAQLFGDQAPTTNPLN